jgi:serine/threonine protein phosphatase PrpC
VADFGIARAMEEEKPLTQRGWALGTEHYIAPEQEHGKPEPASDIYAMGIVAYQIFTGLLPFQAVIKNHAASLPNPSELNLTLPPAVDDVILRTIEIDPSKRFRTGKDFADALNDALIAENIWSQPTISENVATLVTTSNANTIVRVMIPDNPCARCGGENRSSSRFCRHCGHGLNDTSPLIHEANQVGYLSDNGLQSVNNEDMILVVQGLAVNLPSLPRSFGLFAVADGLRGKQGTTTGGQEASRLAIETVADIMVPLLTTTATGPQSGSGGSGTHRQISLARQTTSPEQTKTILEQWTRDAVRQANQVIYHCNADYGVSMASTLTTALIYKHIVSIASIGDSRAYHYNPQKGLHLITRDHTLAANLVEADLLQPDELYQSPKRHQHYRYLGHNHTIKIDTFQFDIEANDKILLCTDGLWHMLPDQRIQEILESDENPQINAQRLINTANAAGGEGNISAIVIHAQ